MTELTDIEVPFRRLLVCASGSLGACHLPTSLVCMRRLCPSTTVRVALTQAAVPLVGTAALAALTRGPVYVCGHEGGPGQIAHIELAQWADAVLVMPATADIIGKAANGIADDLVTSILIAAHGSVVYVPSMNSRMWSNPALSRNIRTLRSDGAIVVEPTLGLETADNVDFGSMAPLAEVIRALVRATRKKAGGDR